MSSSLSDLSILSSLRSHSEGTDNTNASQILSHITTLIREQLENKSQLKGMSNLQVFSYYLRKNKFNFQQLMRDHELNAEKSRPQQKPEYVSKVQSLSKKAQKLQIRKPFVRPHILEEYHQLKQCGISIGETNTVHLNNVVKTLAAENQCTEVRFWGKILGYRDYFVIQGRTLKKYHSDLGPDSEQYGTGINTYSYWVSNSVLGQWTELPLVNPAQVKASRQFKYIFSGNLEKDINSLSQQFQGKQKHLLKCVIARITHSCQLAPKGLYKSNEQNPNIVELQEEFKTPELTEMNSLQSWIHLNAHILNQGRSSYYVDPALNEEEKEAYLTQLGESDPMVERLKGISEDKPFEGLGYTANWTAELCGESVPINLVGKQEGQSALYACVLLKNLVWPGAATIGYRGGWCNVYVGYGQRLSQPNSLIAQLANLQVEGEDKKEVSEPNPSKAPVEESKAEEGNEEPAQEQQPAE